MGESFIGSLRAVHGPPLAWPAALRAGGAFGAGAGPVGASVGACRRPSWPSAHTGLVGELGLGGPGDGGGPAFGEDQFDLGAREGAGQVEALGLRAADVAEGDQL